MIPPPEYFRKCQATEPSAQRVGPDWFTFKDPHCLELWLEEIETKKHTPTTDQPGLTLE